MSRDLPRYPSLEHLKKQARHLLREWQAHKPGAKLADAQHAIAHEYGFSTWTDLKSHVESARSAENPLAGRWRADLSRSTPLSLRPFQAATLEFIVDRDTVTIEDVVVEASGRVERTTNVIHADGQDRAVDHGYVVTARWSDPRRLETIVKKGEHVEGRVTYEVSSDGRTLWLRAGKHLGVFTRA
jgi:hypothetical protein